MNDEFFMAQAIDLATAAVRHGNEPFGSVLVLDGRVVFSGENQVKTRHDPTYHGETGLIRDFCGSTGITDLREYTLYTNCEPCFMCSGAMVWAKLGRLVYAASNRDLVSIFGKEGSDCSRLVFSRSGWQPEVTAGVLLQESLRLLQEYFGKFVL